MLECGGGESRNTRSNILYTVLNLYFGRRSITVAFAQSVRNVAPTQKMKRKRGGTASYSPPNSVSSSVLLKARGNLLRLFVFSLLLFSQQSPIFLSPPLLCYRGILRDTESSYTLSHFWEKRVLVVQHSTYPPSCLIYYSPPLFQLPWTTFFLEAYWRI